MKKEQFIQEISTAYTFKGASIDLGAAILEGEVLSEAKVRIPLRMMNRHGLIAGATGSGKTKTLQILAEQLSANSVPVLLMDIKGDLSGIAMAGSSNEKIVDRSQKIGIPFQAQGNPVEFYSLSNEKGARLRATVTEFGPVLFSKILGLNETQGGVIAVVFKYCDDKGLPLLDLKDFIKVLQYLSNEGKEEIKAEYGNISSMTIGTILRKVVELQQQGADIFFGETSFDVADLCRIDPNTGKGMISVVRLADIQDKPKLFSTFMLQLLAEIYATFPEKGDVEQPELCVFIDEAHLVFQEATNVLLDQIETVIKLIRSKGVGVYFITQTPNDIPRAVLGQLGLKIQHALRAFTAIDRKNIKLVAENYPITQYYDTENLITQLGIGEALVTGLDEKGIPTPLAYTMLRAPQSRMDVLTPAELDNIVNSSALASHYNKVIDRESAFEMLAQKIEESPKTAEKSSGKAPKEEPGMLEKALDNPITKQIGRTVAREVTRGLLGMLGLGGSSSRKKGWF